MYKNRYGQRNNICGVRLANFRHQHKPPLSQRALADRMQLAGIDLDKNAIQRIENGQRFVTDIELTYIAEVLNLSYDQLLHPADQEEL